MARILPQLKVVVAVCFLAGWVSAETPSLPKPQAKAPAKPATPSKPQPKPVPPPPQPAPSPIDVSVDVDAARILREVPKHLSGVTFYNGKENAVSRIWTVSRDGGNASTMYNWVLGAWNEGCTGGYRNTRYGWAENGNHLMRGATETTYATKDVGADCLLTEPTIGWMPRDGCPGGGNPRFPSPDCVYSLHLAFSGCFTDENGRTISRGMEA